MMAKKNLINDIIQCSMDLTDSIVAGDYNIPKPMCFTINKLQDAVYAYANVNGINIEDNLSEDYKKFKDEYNKLRDEKLIKMLEERRKNELR